MCFSYFPRSDPRLYGEKRGSCSGLDVREGRKEVRVFRVATLVLLDRRPLQFPPFCGGTGVGKLVLCLSLPPVSR